MINKLIIAIFLVVFWFAFSGHTESFFLIAGAVSCAIAFAIALRLGLHNKFAHNRNIFKYIPWLMWQVVLSGVYVTRLVWARKLVLQPQFITTESNTNKELFYAIYANSITMTPGTVTVLIDEKNRKIIVHAISSRTGNDIKQGVMAKKVEEALA